MTSEIKIKKKNMYMILLIVFIVGVGAYFVFINGGGNDEQVVVPPVIGNGEVQNVLLSVKNYNYYPQTITVKSGEPVSLTLDKSVTGCLRSFTIKDLGVNKYSPTPEEVIEFTPNKKGTFRFACSMGMGTGTIIVE